MIEAVVNGKLGSSQSRAYERSEDLLTSTAFGLLRYLPHDRGIIAFLRQTRRVRLLKGDELVVDAEDARNDQWLGMHAAVRCELKFWPWLGQYGQPDLLLRLLNGCGECVHLAVVEVKLDANKSGSAEQNDGECTGDQRDDDQLVKYAQGIDARYPEVASDRKTVIYLTSHVIPPVDELAATIRRKPEMRLGWVSWRQLSRVAESLRESSKESLPAEDLARLLAYHGFQDFRGMRSEPTVWPGKGSFWKNDNWFREQPISDANPFKRFWRAR
jgi:hypothetical protein